MLVRCGRCSSRLITRTSPPISGSRSRLRGSLSVFSQSVQSSLTNVPGHGKSFSTTRKTAISAARSITRALASMKQEQTTIEQETQLNNHVIIRLIHEPQQKSTVANISINNPKKLNSLNSQLIEDLTTAFTEVGREPSLRCIILRGERETSSLKAPSFSAGANIVEMSEIQNSKDAEAFIRRVSGLCSAVRFCPVPVIAAINGPCFGAGLELAASCDVRYATNASKFAMPEVKVGIPSVVEARLLVDIIGWANTRYLTLFGNTINGTTAMRMGLVNELFATIEEMEQRVQDDVDTLFDAGPKAVRSQKSLMRKWEESGVETGIEDGVKAFAEMWDDGGKEPKAYMQKTLAELKAKKSKK